jgi:hypothetical protein
MEAICSSETSVESQRTARLHIPEYNTLQKFDCPARVYCPPATVLCAVPFTRWQLLDCEVVGERQWAVKKNVLIHWHGQLLSNWPVKLLADVFTRGQYLASSYWTPQLARQLAPCKRAFTPRPSYLLSPVAGQFLSLSLSLSLSCPYTGDGRRMPIT